MGTREASAVGMAILGGVATVVSAGESVTVPDVLLSGALWWGITYGIGTLIMKSRTPARHNEIENQRSGVSPSFVSNQSDEMTTEIYEFLSSLKPAPAGQDGWYRDPSNLFMLRYFYQGKWTRAVSDVDSEIEKSEAISKFLPSLQSPFKQTTSAMNSHHSEEARTIQVGHDEEKDTASIGQKVEHLERLATLREKHMISDEEFELLKNQIIWPENAKNIYEN